MIPRIMLTRRNSIVLSAKGVAALMAAMPFLRGCAPEGDGPAVVPLDPEADMGPGGAMAPPSAPDARAVVVSSTGQQTVTTRDTGLTGPCLPRARSGTSSGRTWSRVQCYRGLASSVCARYI